MSVARELNRHEMAAALASEVADDGLSAARGLLLASLIGVAMWAAIIAGVITLFF